MVIDEYDWHTIKEDHLFKWENILQLFNQLLQIRYSPIAALNRTYAVSKVRGKEAAIHEALKLPLNNNQFYHSLLGELFKESDPATSRSHFEKALLLAKTTGEKNMMRSHLESLKD